MRHTPVPTLSGHPLSKRGVIELGGLCPTNSQKGCVRNIVKKQFVHYNPRLKGYARKLRRNSTLSEVLLWNELKRNQMMGYDFHRQKPIDEYIVDFYCPVLNLAIEIDGDSHVFKKERDSIRQRRLEQLGIQFLRFDDLDVKFRMQGVLDTIRELIEDMENEAIH